MKRKCIILAGFFLMLGVIGFAQSGDRKKGNPEVAPVISYPEGIVYALPRTVVVVKVTARREEFIPGPYAAYAKKYLGYAQVGMQNRTTWSITGIDIDLLGEPDPQAMFKAMDSLAARVSLTSDGRISGLDSKAVPGEFQLTKRSFIVNNDVPELSFPDLSSSDEYDVMVDPATGGEKLIGKSTETKAQEAADYLIKLRKKRAFTILSPTDVVPEGGDAYPAFLDEAKRLEKEYVGLFAGKTYTSDHQFIFEYIPGEKESRNDILFRFSEEKGILPVSDVTGRPVVIDVSRNNQAYSKASELKSSQNPQAGKSGLYYRIPVMGEVSISNGLSPLFSARIPIAQFGVVAPLPEDLINGKYTLLFDTVTGSVRQLAKK